jgi:hypothetical protein
MKVFTSGSAKIVAMKSDNLDIREFVANTEGMGRDERYITAQRELRDAEQAALRTAQRCHESRGSEN